MFYHFTKLKKVPFKEKLQRGENFNVLKSINMYKTQKYRRRSRETQIITLSRSTWKDFKNSDAWGPPRLSQSKNLAQWCWACVRFKAHGVVLKSYAWVESPVYPVSERSDWRQLSSQAMWKTPADQQLSGGISHCLGFPRKHLLKIMASL